MKRMLLLSFLLAITSMTLYGQKINEPYIYPIRPGTEKWVLLGGTMERVQACQIPPDILTNLETSALAETCLAFPFFSDVFLYNDLQTGFEKVKSYFNGLPELLKRNDAGMKLMSTYNSLLIDDLGSWENKKLWKHFSKILFVELTLSQNEIIQNMTAGDRKLLRSMAIKHFEQKLRYPDRFGPASLISSSLVLAKVMKIQNETAALVKINPTGDLELFCRRVQFTNDRLLYDIYQASKSL
jgi:hypothetical protein